MKSKNVATYGMLVALAFILSYIENVFPIPLPIPGIKIGLANLVVLVALYTMGVKQAFLLSLLRIVLVGFSFGSLSTMLFSFAGGILSWGLMVGAKRCKQFSMTGVSIVGGIGHNIGQILVAMWVVDTSAVIYYLPILMVSGVVAGLAVGILGGLVVSKLKG